MPTQEERLETVEFNLRQFKTETVKVYQDMAFEMTIVKALTEDSIGRLAKLNETTQRNFERIDTRLDGMDAHLEHMGRDASFPGRDPPFPDGYSSFPGRDPPFPGGYSSFPGRDPSFPGGYSLRPRRKYARSNSGALARKILIGAYQRTK
jgi:hypothetical protein